MDLRIQVSGFRCQCEVTSVGTVCRVDYWNNGMVEYWNSEWTAKISVRNLSSFHFSNIPVFHRSVDVSDLVIERNKPWRFPHSQVNRPQRRCSSIWPASNVSITSASLTWGT